MYCIATSGEVALISAFLYCLPSCPSHVLYCPSVSLSMEANLHHYAEVIPTTSKQLSIIAKVKAATPSDASVSTLAPPQQPVSHCISADHRAALHYLVPLTVHRLN